MIIYHLIVKTGMFPHGSYKPSIACVPSQDFTVRRRKEESFMQRKRTTPCVRNRSPVFCPSLTGLLRPL